MEFMIQSISLLSGIRKSMTKRISIGLPMSKVDGPLVAFITDSLKQNPGNTELCIQIFDEESEQVVRLRTNGTKFSPDDAFIQFLQQRDDIRYGIELT